MSEAHVCVYKQSGFAPLRLDSLSCMVRVPGLPVCETRTALQEPEYSRNAMKTLVGCGALGHCGDEHLILGLWECLTLITGFTKFLFSLLSLCFFCAFPVIYANQVQTSDQLRFFFFPHLNCRNKTTCNVFMGKACSSHPFMTLSYPAPRPHCKEIQTFP